jgi:hypothetical protein
MTTRWRKPQFISFSQKVLLACNAPPQAAKQPLEHNVGPVVLMRTFLVPPDQVDNFLEAARLDLGTAPSRSNRQDDFRIGSAR